MPDPIVPCGAGHLATCSNRDCDWEAYQPSRDRLSIQLSNHLKTCKKKGDTP